MLALQLRTPMVVAMAGATLQALHPDNDIVLGIGISSPVVTSRWHGVPYGDRPLAQTREYVALLRECLTGEKVDFAGDFYQVKGFRLGVRLGERRPEDRDRRPQPEDARSWPARWPTAWPSTTCPPPTSPGRWSRCARAATPRSTPTSTPGVCEREEGVELARRDLFSYAVVDCLRAELRASRATATRSPRSAPATPTATGPGALAAVSDRMVDGIDVMGDADTVHATMQAYVDAGVDVPVLMPLPWGADRRASADLTIRAAIGQGLAMELRDKVVLVTGGANGIGRALCRAVRGRGRARAWRSSTSTAPGADGRGRPSSATAPSGSAADVGREADVVAAVRADRGALRSDRPAGVERRHRRPAAASRRPTRRGSRSGTST